MSDVKSTGFTALGLIMDLPTVQHPITPNPDDIVIDSLSHERNAMGTSVPSSQRITLSGVPLMPVGTKLQISGSSNPKNNGTFQVKSSPKPQLPVEMVIPLEAARALTTRQNHKGSVKRHRRSLRILDHGPYWKEQHCNERFKIVRWNGSNPPEWKRVGWAIGKTYYSSRKAAAQAKRDLIRIAEVMDS